MSDKSGSRIALITGAGGGIGAASAEALCKAGYRVVLVDRDARNFTALGQRIPAESSLMLTIDITRPGAAEEINREVRRRFGPVSILVNNAGIAPKKDGRAVGLLDTTDTLWNEVFDVNLTAALRLCRQFVPAMRDMRWGRIVNISSMAARTRALMAGPSYASSKAGMLGLTRSVAAEFAKDGITANCIAPGRIATPMAAVTDNVLNAQLMAQIPVKRFGTPQEMAHAVAFLAAEEAGFITGAVLDINGGFFMA